MFLSPSLLKSIEFGSSGEDSQNSSSEAAMTGSGGKPKTLESLLLEKNRALQSENTQLKVATNENTGKNALTGGCFYPESDHSVVCITDFCH